ncbi:MAG: DUF5357 domain-containing protein, partial [Okeania sp. SIO2D1]|nr:DUF5357 domain-containing protein [Okeania sp. SIO2D1]
MPVKTIGNVFAQVKNELTPESAYSWQIPILLSLFSWLMSLISTGFIRTLIATFGWLFLIIGVNWVTKKNSIPFGPWITGWLICVLLFGSFTGEIPPVAVVMWPLVSAGVVVFSKSLDQEINLHVPPPAARLELVILIGTQLLLSCWLQFYFVTQN